MNRKLARFLLAAASLSFAALAPASPIEGDVFPDFSGKTYDGQPVKLADYKGKVVLVDFWATWCGPCRRELPNVKKAYKRFHDKGFEVVGISFDREASAMKKYLEDPATALPWKSTFDGKGWESDFASQYGVHSIPAAFLLGKDGKVVATGLRGQELTNKVGSLVEPGFVPRPIFRSLFNAFILNDSGDKTYVTDQMLDQAMEDQDIVIETASMYLEGNQPREPKPEGAALVLMLLDPSIAEARNHQALALAALAAFTMKDFARAAELQSTASKLLGPWVAEQRKDWGSSAGTTPPMHPLEVDYVARLALYQAHGGKADAARATLAPIEATPAGKASLSRSRYYTKAMEKLAGGA